MSFDTHAQPAQPSHPDIDLMNDPARATNSPRDASSGTNQEPDHCRICRSEATLQEPLYHPCKCSGSIKFVHQDCLMEWLAHSQKKYCELCKTQFTFTKVYDPDMPRTLPTPLFLRQLSRRLARAVVRFLRAGLVAFVWLGCLPWCVRWMWRGWFWLSDGGFWQPGYDTGQHTGMATFEAETRSTATEAANATATSTGVFPILIPSVIASLLSPAGSNGTANSNVSSTYPDGIFFDRNPFFNSTRFQFVNGLIVDVLEGQLLTALIVVTFIIIFLIREWVVQQQPAMIGDAANIPLLNEQIPAPPEPVDLPPPPPLADDAEEEAAPAQDDANEDAWLARAFAPEPEEAAEELERESAADETVGTEVPQPRVIAQPRARRRRAAVEDTAEQAEGSNTPEVAPITDTPRSGSATGFSFHDVPPRPTREVMHPGANPRRELEENSPASTNTPPPPPPPPPVYTFGSTGGSTENPFQFGGGNPEPSRPPSMWTQTTPQDTRPVEDISDRLELIDTGRSREWMRENTASTPSSPAASGPRTPDFGYDRSGSASWGSTGSFEFVGATQDKGKEKEVQGSIEGDIEGSASKSKGKEAAQMNAQVDSDKEEEEAIPVEAGGSLDVGTSEWSTRAQAGDTPTTPSDSSSTPPLVMPPTPPPIPRLDRPYQQRPGTDLPRQEAQRLDDARRIEEIRNRIMRREETARLEREERERRIPVAEEPQAANEGGEIAPQPGGQGRRGGFLDWLVGEDEDAAPPNANDEPGDEAAPAAPVAPVPQGMLDDDVADDFEGIMELVGMRGPIIGLVQNAAISSMLITATVALGVAFPYVTGKTVMMILAHPIFFFFRLPWMMMSFGAEFLVDSTTMVAFSLLLLLDHAVKFFLRPLSSLLGLSKIAANHSVTTFLQNWARDGQARVVAKIVSIETTYVAIRKFPASAVPPLSLVLKESFGQFLGYLSWAASKIGLKGLSTMKLPFGVPNPVYWTTQKWQDTVATVDFHQPANATVSATQDLLPGVYKWTAWDRIGVVLLGYAFFTFVGMIWVSRRRGQHTGHVSRLIAEILQQCGGVMKVVLIIGIEMFVFPLYCGVLLDMAMLPLFETATLASRLQFAVDFPLTNVFVHWFVGTCYMFHFALFVSMCRKIMRSGVLYFIRDPDDPTFHPVRDVLNRPVTTQLRKIGFSAFIYGVLVLVCLGGVVWGLFGLTKNVLPIHWSSNEPVFEFPVDLLFYNFLMPLAVKFFKPSDGLQNMYAWWFRKCARALRLTSFMFGERHSDEEGYTHYPSFSSFIWHEKPDYDNPVMPEEVGPSYAVYFKRDGRFVRAPASDSVRRPKDASVFIPVDENNRRLDVEPSQDPPTGPTGANSPDWRLAYIPPYFRLRIGLVVLGIWFFAACTGVSLTIGPLLLGRALLRQLIPAQIKLNDIYAFSIGIYVIGGVALLLTKLPAAYRRLKALAAPLTAAASNVSTPEKVKHVRHTATAFILRTLKISYLLTAFAIVIPTLVALLIEFYLIMPLHTAFSDSTASTFENNNVVGIISNITAAAAAAPPPPAVGPRLGHTIHFIQDWTLGVLYVKMAGKMLLLDDQSLWARSLRGIVAPGWLNPDARLATRVFVAPCIGYMLLALLGPICLAFAVIKVGLLPNHPEVFRLAYPACASLAAISVAVYAAWRVVEGWKEGVRDEVYLRGMRVHNHGERAET